MTAVANKNTPANAEIALRLHSHDHRPGVAEFYHRRNACQSKNLFLKTRISIQRKK